MPKKKFAVEEGAPKRLEVEWSGQFDTTTFRWDGATLSEHDGFEMTEGVTLSLPEGFTVEAMAVRGGGFWPGSKVKRLTLRFPDGSPVPGSDEDPREASRQAGYLLYFIAGLNALCGVIAIVTGADALAAAEIGVGQMCAGVLYGVLGLFTMRGSRVALAIAMGLYAVDGIATLAMSVGGGGSPSVFGLFIRIGFLIALGTAFRTMKPRR